MPEFVATRGILPDLVIPNVKPKKYQVCEAIKPRVHNVVGKMQTGCSSILY